MNGVIWIIFLYYFITNVIAIMITIRDKVAAVNKRRRVSEKNLMLLAILSSGIGMWITMLLIHHKTKKRKFMIGLPMIFVMELLIIIVVLKLTLVI